MFTRSRHFFTLVVLLTVATTAALAHEFWIRPPQFFVAAGSTRSLQVLVGENFAGERWTGKSSRVLRLVHYTPTSPEDLTRTATTADTLHAAVTFRQPGTHAVTLTTTNAFLTQDADKFNAYLKEEGLDNALLLRQRNGTLTQPGREAYRRCATTLVQVAGTAAAPDTARAWGRPQGLPLELVPEQNPYALRIGASLTVRVLAAGQPQSGQLVQVWQLDSNQKLQIFRLRSNQNGRVLFRLTSPGTYMVSTVQMKPDDLPNADWQSTWSTLTFGFREIPGR